MSETLDPKEAKTLSDILAMVLDGQPGSSEAALGRLRQRAAADGVTGGALKNMFVRLVEGARRPAAAPAEDVEALRDVAAVQASTIRQLQQQVRVARTALEQAIEARDDLETVTANRRTMLFIGLGCGAVTGGGLGWLLAWRMGVLWAPPPPPVRVPAPPPVAGTTVIVPPVRDPTDTAPQPEYPAEAKARGEHGTVALLVHIDADGQVGAIGVSQSAGADLDVAAQQAVREWRFRPRDAGWDAGGVGDDVAVYVYAAAQVAKML